MTAAGVYGDLSITLPIETCLRSWKSSCNAGIAADLDEPF
jgi:hypothetical protein